ncbi:MAG: hypothetical protein JSS61_02635 [Verrucomicrobia bacterium]|nr:hypothetical protein [Verrucomicrobiota bacterium]
MTTRVNDIFYYISLDDWKGVRDILNENPSAIEAKTRMDGSPLSLALFRRAFRSAQVLVDRGASFDEATWHAVVSPIDCNSEKTKSSLDILARKILQKVDPTQFGWSKIEVASWFGLYDLVHSELKKEPPVGAVLSSLKLSLVRGHIHCVYDLLKSEKGCLENLGISKFSLKVPCYDLLTFFQNYQSPVRDERIKEWVEQRLLETSGAEQLEYCFIFRDNAQDRKKLAQAASGGTGEAVH